MTINPAVPAKSHDAANHIALSPGLITPDFTREIVPGLFYDGYFDGRMVSYRLTNISLAIIDQWAELIIHTLENWPADRPYLAQHDVSAPGVSLQYGCLVNFDTINIGVTSAGRDQVHRILDARSQHAQIALNFNLSLSGHVNKVLTDHRYLRFRSGHPLVSYRTFYNSDKSLAWLLTSFEAGISAVQLG
jgi:hypothetical protein